MVDTASVKNEDPEVAHLVDLWITRSAQVTRPMKVFPSFSGEFVSASQGMVLTYT